jgi:hypothetical protein
VWCVALDDDWRGMHRIWANEVNMMRFASYTENHAETREGETRGPCSRALLFAGTPTICRTNTNNHHQKMNCPYCSKDIYGLTGLQEAQAFQRHLGKCRKNPNNIVLSDGRKTVVSPKRCQNLMDALSIRADSGQ